MSLIQLAHATPLESAAFRGNIVRIERTNRIIYDLQQGGSCRAQRLKELRDLEDLSVQTRHANRVETFVDARGWNEARTRMRYLSPSGESIGEDLILFYRAASEGGVEWLTVDRAVPLIPTGLFDARLVSRKHGVPTPDRTCEIRMIPHIGNGGREYGVYSILIDAR